MAQHVKTSLAYIIQSFRKAVYRQVAQGVRHVSWLTNTSCQDRWEAYPTGLLAVICGAPTRDEGEGGDAFSSRHRHPWPRPARHKLDYPVIPSWFSNPRSVSQRLPPRKSSACKSDKWHALTAHWASQISSPYLPCLFFLFTTVQVKPQWEVAGATTLLKY